MLKIDKLFIAFDNKRILENTDFSALDGQLTVITGESGIGKSTLLNALTLDQSFNGEYTYHNQYVDKEFIRQHIYKVEQFPIFINTLDIQGHFDLVSSNESNYSFMDKLGIRALLKKYPNQLSDGEKKRVAITLALTSHKDILILDEPTSSLNEEYIEIVSELLVDYAHFGHTVIVSSHDQKIVEYGDKVYEIEYLHLKEKSTHYSSIENSTSINKYKKLRLNHYLKMTVREINNQVLSKGLILILVSVSLLLVHFNNSAARFHTNLVNDISSREIIVYKSVDGEGHIEYSFNNYEFPLTQQEIDELYQVEHIETLGYHYSVSLLNDLEQVQINEVLFAGESVYSPISEVWYGILPKSNGIILKKDFLPEEPQENENQYPFYLRTFDPNYNYKDKMERILTDEKGIYVSKDLFDLLYKEAYDSNYLTLYFPILVPIYNVSGASSLHTENSNIAYETNQIETKEIWVDLPVKGILKEDNFYDNDYSDGTVYEIYLDRDILDLYIDQYREIESFTEYWVGPFGQTVFYKNEVPEELQDQIRNTVYKTPWSPNCYIIYVDNIMNINKVLNDLIPLGLDATCIYIDATSLQAAVNGTKNTIKTLGYMVVIFVLCVAYVSKKKELSTRINMKRFLVNLGMNYKKVYRVRVNEIGISFTLRLFIISLLSFVLVYLIRIVMINNTTYSLSMFGLGILLIFIIEVVFPLFLERKMYKNDKY